MSRLQPPYILYNPILPSVYQIMRKKTTYRHLEVLRPSKQLKRATQFRLTFVRSISTRRDHIPYWHCCDPRTGDDPRNNNCNGDHLDFTLKLLPMNDEKLGSTESDTVTKNLVHTIVKQKGRSRMLILLPQYKYNLQQN